MTKWIWALACLYIRTAAIPWKEFTYDIKSSSTENIVRSIVDGLASLLDGNGFVDNLGIAEEKEYNFFEKDNNKSDSK